MEWIGNHRKQNMDTIIFLNCCADIIVHRIGPHISIVADDSLIVTIYLGHRNVFNYLK